ncbi:unnamed protein product [Ranitomeya imitator]|uniref:Chromo domain-containing protein n=1 Tax=Ranitomeya imitator TaxID=111125 RepID=A0ABN9KRE8_9NEOB|nr:unnamed protein product [Ranitomeya imitator]
MDPVKVQAIHDWTQPTSLKSLQKFLGFPNFYRRFICNFSSIAKPLTDLTKKGADLVNWSSAAVEAFQELKRRFSSTPVLCQPDVSLPFQVEVDASEIGAGAVLSQRGSDCSVIKPCAFFSRKFSPAERNYDVGNRELLAMKWAFEEWRHWLEGAKHRVVVLTDHKNLTYLESAKRLNPRQARWSLFFARFDFVISYLPGSKNVKADALSRSFVPDSPGLSEPAGILKEGTNGQTERTNQTMETYLRCFVSADQDDWVSFLPLAEFALNNRASSATLVSPFFCNSGFHPRFSSGQVESSDCPGVDTVVDRLQQIWTHVVDNLTLSQEKAQRFANRRRCVGPRLRVGDLVWLSSRHIQMKVSSPKFKPRFIGPYRISEVLNPVSFRLTLPDSFSIHNVFHRSLLRRYVAPMVPSVDPPAPVLVEGELEYIVEKILDSRVSRRKLQYLVKWKGYAQEDNSWVFASDVHAPDLVRAFHVAHPGRPGGSVPLNYHRELEHYTLQGFRVIALAYKTLATNNAQIIESLEREEVESDLVFLGFLIMENKLKPQTKPVIQELTEAKIRTVMITGDNLQTACTIGKASGMIPPGSELIVIEANAPEGSYPASITWGSTEKIQDKSNAPQDSCISICDAKQSFHFAMTGKSYKVIVNHFYELLPKILLKGTIFARMSPGQKSSLIEELQKIDYYAGMCGDGANDCGVSNV